MLITPALYASNQALLLRTLERAELEVKRAEIAEAELAIVKVLGQFFLFLCVPGPPSLQMPNVGCLESRFVALPTGKA